MNWAAVEPLLDEAEGRFGPIALRVSNGDDLLYERRSSIADRRIRVASAGKWVAGVVVLRLVDEGLLPLDDELQLLMSHTSGMVAEHDAVGDPSLTLAEAAAAIRAEPLRFKPGTVFAYGNASMQVAASMAEAASGRRWVDMAGFEYGDSPANPHVGGGMRATLAELDAFLATVESGEALSGRSLVEMERDRTEGLRKEANPAPLSWGYGIGCWIEEHDADGEPVRMVSPGATGVHVWIDRNLESPHRGVLFMDHDPDDFRATNRLYLEVCRRAMVAS